MHKAKCRFTFNQLTLLATSAAIWLLASCAAPSQAPLTAEPQVSQANGDTYTYDGTVGNRASIFTLTWQSDGNVQGHYQDLADGAGTTYQLKGNNTRNGELVLTEYTAGKQSAILTLKKSLANGGITWSGKMHNTDGRVWKVSFSRRPQKNEEINECCFLQHHGPAEPWVGEFFHV